jgi:uncharacterized membrane protein
VAPGLPEGLTRVHEIPSKDQPQYRQKADILSKEVSMVKTACKILGFVLIATGIVGFFKHDLAGFHLTTIHNIVHLVTGGVALYFGFATTVAAARMFCLIVGAIYLILGIVGFVAPTLITAIIQSHGADVNLLPDNIVHLVLGAAFLIVGWLVAPQPTAPTESRA